MHTDLNGVKLDGWIAEYDDGPFNPLDVDDAHYIDGHPEEFMMVDRIRARETIDRAYEEATLCP